MSEPDDNIVEFPQPKAASPELRAGAGFSLDLLNLREWLERAVEAKGAKVIAGGCGFGQGDIDIKLEGMFYNISIRPIIRQPANTSEQP